MAHFTNHWRQPYQEPFTLSSCIYESNLGIKVPPVPHSEDLEVSNHFNNGYHKNEETLSYSYSPQTEPSNLTLSGARCSPLNLTGRSKSLSPCPANLSLNHGVQNIPNENSEETMQNQAMYGMTVMSTNNEPVQPLPMNNQMLESTCPMFNPYYKKRKKNNSSEFFCSVCQKLFFTKASLAEHSITHKNVLPNTQYLMSTEQVGMNQSVDNAICSFSEKSYQCSVCDQEFTYREELLEHIEVHESSKPFKCDICGKRMSYRSALHRHKRIHNNTVRPHKCQVCGKAFNQKFDLERHKTTHEKHVQCDPCKRTFSSPQYLKRHKCKFKEPSSSQFNCTICDRGFDNNIAWSYHMWKHTKNAAFVPFQNE